MSPVDAGLQRGFAEVVRIGVRELRKEPAGGRLEHEAFARHSTVPLGPTTGARLVRPSGDGPHKTEVSAYFRKVVGSSEGDVDFDLRHSATVVR